MWNLVSVYLETVLVSVQDRCTVHGLRRTYHRLGNHFGRTRWNCLGTWALWKLISVHLEIVLILTQDWSMVCAERIVGPKINSDVPDGTPR
jgi:hypothetical protein